nr:acyl-CoA desaturase [Rhodococcus sp. HNM0569]
MWGIIIAPTSAARRYTSNYSDLLAEVRAAGLLERAYTFYWIRIVGTIGAFFAVWVASALLGDSWLQLGLAVVLAVVSAQFGFLGHDAAHRQIFESARWNLWSARILAGGFAGLSYTWWQGKHSKHHRAPNQSGYDPDIEGGPIAWEGGDARARSGLYRLFTRLQGWLFFPLLTLEGAALHVASLQTLTTGKGLAHRYTEFALVTARLTIGFVLPFVLMPPLLAVAFVVVHLAVFGVLLGGAFAPNHKGMPVVEKGELGDYLSRQVVVSRNIDGGPVTDFMMGGLNYQVEHHLFPSMPRAHLARAQPFVRAHCARHGVPYTQTSLITSYGIVVRYLNHVGIGHRDPFVCPLRTAYRA